MRLHHVQVACPSGGEDAARRFYAAGLGMTEVQKPAELASREPYAGHVRDARVPTSHDPDDYARALLDLGCEVDAWETTYLHVLTGEDPVFRWVSGTGARPTLQALPGHLRPRFEDEFKRRLRAAYPDTGRGVVLPFRRVFVVARTPTHGGER